MMMIVVVVASTEEPLTCQPLSEHFSQLVHLILTTAQ